MIRNCCDRSYKRRISLLNVDVRAGLSNQISFSKRRYKVAFLGNRRPGECLAGGVFHTDLTAGYHRTKSIRSANESDRHDIPVLMTENEDF